MELNGALSNPRLQVELRPLKALLMKVSVQEWPGGPHRPELGFRQGTVLEAVTEVLRLAQRPMRARDVRVAVEVALGTPIPASTVREALSTHARGGDLRFRRVAYGVYERRITTPLTRTTGRAPLCSEAYPQSALIDVRLRGRRSNRAS